MLTKATKPATGHLSYMDQREYDAMEETIEQAEEEERLLQREMEQPDTVTDPQRLHDCRQKLEEVRRTIQRLYDRWEELESKKSTE